ncbi:hypothetical protein I4U23_025103 [Adineta vaga]|nr:hypothetical protein I4U23_025103 [Adineta vaga]
MTVENALEPSSTLDEMEEDFQAWKESMSNEIQLPGGLSSESRQKLWISLAKNYIHDVHLDWDKTRQFAFNPESYPEDEQLNNQIVKDLHRTGCNWSTNEQNRIILQRVLLAFARYNKSIGYCQGLHILTSVILDVMNMNEEHALMILIYLIDSILPDFFSNNLHALAIDMTVFDHWLKVYNPQLHLHLKNLQSTSSSNDDEGGNYEPPLLNVFTIQWFLTLFVTCLPRQATLRVWDALMIEGSEVLFRTGLLLWSKLSIAVLKVSTADQFYSAMSHLSVQLLDEKIIIADNLIHEIYNLGPFPTPFLSDLRQKFSIQQPSNQTNHTDQSKSKDLKRIKTKLLDEEIVNFISCFAILSSSSLRNNRLAEKSNSPDVNQLRQQYKKLQQRNKQVQIISQSSNTQQQCSPDSICSISAGPLMNHLLVKPTDIKRNQLKKNVSSKSLSSKEQTEEYEKEIEQLLTCLNVSQSTKIPENNQKKSSSDDYINRLITSRSAQIPKYSSFNPFPSRSFNENVAVNGYRLGLYSPVVTSR